MINVEDLGDGFYRLTNPEGKVRDVRTNRRYSAVVCSERNVRYFEAA